MKGHRVKCGLLKYINQKEFSYLLNEVDECKYTVNGVNN